ncbi:MAG: HD domain-containing protein [Nitrososphaerales archaeon]
MERAAEIRDPIHGYIYLNQAEKELVDSWVFQRLRRIKQLASTYLTYPAAQHTRFEHSIGTFYLADRAGRVLMDKSYIDDKKVKELRIATLLHDIGHGPFSHLIEEIMSYKYGLTHEDITHKVIKSTEIRDILSKNGFDEDKIAYLSLGLYKDYPKFLNEVIGGGLSVDMMDYLLRDSYFTGVEYGRVDVHRVINSYEVIKDSLALDSAGLYAFEALILARYEMFRAVYFHRTVRAAEIMLARAIELADDYLGIANPKDLEPYLLRTDDTALQELVTLDERGSIELRKAKDLALRYRDRKLLKCVYEESFMRRESLIKGIFSERRIRKEIERKIADEAKVSEDEVFLDVPTAPSIPFGAFREALMSINLLYKGLKGLETKELNVKDLPLVKSLEGFLDIIRVYTTQENRERVGEATLRFFRREGFEEKVSM